MKVQDVFHSAQLKFGMDQTNARFADDFFAACTDAQNDLANRRSWGCLVTSATMTTVDGTRTVAVPSTFGRLVEEYGSMRITSPSASEGSIIKAITLADYTHASWDSDEEGTPSLVWIEGDYFNFSPVPDAAYTVKYWYYKRPTTVLTTDDDFTFPDSYMEMVKRAIYKRLADDGYTGVQELAITENDVERLFRRAALDDESRYGAMMFNLPNSGQTIYTT